MRTHKKFLSSESGGMTALGLYLGAATFMVGGLAIDVSNLIKVRTQLQVAADLAAHAALYSRERNDAATSKAIAMARVSESFPAIVHGNLLTVNDISFGSYNKSTLGFDVDDTMTEAVYVRTDRISSEGNPVASYFMQFVGMHEWDVATTSVFETYRPNCLRDGWIGEDVVDAQSNNDWADGYCVHSNEQVEFNNNSTFDSTVTVSMPGGHDTIVLPSSGYASNTGLYEAVEDDYMNLRILRNLDLVWAGLADSSSEYYRPYLAGADPDSPVSLPGKNVDTGDFAPNQVYTYNCSGNQRLTIDASPTLKDVMIVTNCKIFMRNGSSFEDVTIWTTNTDDKSITGSHVRFGADDNCDPAGGVNIVTAGGVEFASGLEIYSSQVIAQGPIQFAAAANGVEGGSFISGETIDGTSNTAMSGCPNDAGEVFEIDLFRMVG